MSRRRRPEYDSKQFRDDWHSSEPLRVIAKKYGVTITTIQGAAYRRGFPPRIYARGSNAA